MKSTFGAISTAGQKPCAPSFDTIGFFARSIDDLQLLADVFGLEDNETPKDIPLDQIYVAVIKTPFWSSSGSEKRHQSRRSLLLSRSLRPQGARENTRRHHSERSTRIAFTRVSPPQSKIGIRSP
ncbi:hypothetical protein LB505_002006 [Fusarium chuoi]|nr:hypothetical protein LB505_002006 [Fusarium chuoi]